MVLAQGASRNWRDLRSRPGNEADFACGPKSASLPRRLRFLELTPGSCPTAPTQRRRRNVPRLLPGPRESAMHANASRLGAITKDLSRQWQQTREYWLDA